VAGENVSAARLAVLIDADNAQASITEALLAEVAKCPPPLQSNQPHARKRTQQGEAADFRLRLLLDCRGSPVVRPESRLGAP
jgi:hypothetical protein